MERNMLQEMTIDEMREANGGCCFFKFFFRFFRGGCCKPCKPCKPPKPEEGGGTEQPA